MTRIHFLLLAAFFLLMGLGLLLLVPHLLLTQIGSLPIGNFLLWPTFVALPVIILSSDRRLWQPTNTVERRFRQMLQLGIVLAVLWMVVGYGLSGNWGFNFSGNSTEFRGGPVTSRYYWYYNYTMLGLPLLTGLLYGGYRLWRRIFKR